MKTAVLWIILAVVVVGGGIWWWAASQGQASPTAINTPSTSQQAAASGTQQNSGQNAIVSANGNSNAALQTDLSNIDGQMNGFSSDNASINQGLNDQPVQQSY